MTFQIISDSACDLTAEDLKAKDIDIIYFTFELDGKEYIDDDVSITYDDLYQKLSEGKMAKTSSINTPTFKEHFEPYLKKGEDVVCLTMSSGMTSTYENAVRAKNELKEIYPDNDVFVVDSLFASASMALMLDELVRLRDEGKSAEEAAAWLEANKKRVCTWVATTDLKHLVYGGRLSAPAGWIGGKLNICPIIVVDDKGRLTPYKMVRSKKKTLKTIIDMYQKHALKDQPVYIIYAQYPDDAIYIRDQIAELNPAIKDKLHIRRLGATIGSHTGPHLVGIFVWTKDDSLRYLK